MSRISEHIILPQKTGKLVNFIFEGKTFQGRRGEALSSALIAGGVHVFSHHHKDSSAQGIFCANGQCAQCSVLVDGAPVKSCVTAVREGMNVRRINGLPGLSPGGKLGFSEIEEISVPVLIIGGGPAGLCAAIELGKLGCETLVVDDKDSLGGKLVLQTHKFFGSASGSRAGERGIAIAEWLSKEVEKFPSVKIRLNSFAAGVFSDGKIGVLKDGKYFLVKPRAVLISAGAREKMLDFPGSTLPGILGAGAFQTLVNRDLVSPCRRLFVIGAGNVGLIAAYHALQAGIAVAGIAEAASSAGGYKVHADKILRLGVPLYCRHTAIRANGKDRVESITIAEVDENFKPISGSEKTFAADAVLIAVGLNPCSELFLQAKSFGMKVFSAGDSSEIAEASAAMADGKIAGLEIAGALGISAGNPPQSWRKELAVLKSRPGKISAPVEPLQNSGIFPVFHCRQEIPCDPCVSACPAKAIKLETEEITSLPYFEGKCTGCGKCVSVCPGLAVTLVDKRKPGEFAVVTLAFEIRQAAFKKGDTVKLTDSDGNPICGGTVLSLRENPPGTLLVSVSVEKRFAEKVAGIRICEEARPEAASSPCSDGEIIICRCERVSLGELKKACAGARDINEIKAKTRACMGACGGKNCQGAVVSLLKSSGAKEVVPNTLRPLEMEIQLAALAGAEETL